MSACTFKIITPHSRTTHNFHEWFFPNGWRGIGPIEKRDRGGRLVGNRSIYAPDWFVLACNNPDCNGRAVVPVSVLTDHADQQDPEVPA